MQNFLMTPTNAVETEPWFISREPYPSRHKHDDKKCHQQSTYTDQQIKSAEHNKIYL